MSRSGPVTRRRFVASATGAIAAPLVAGNMSGVAAQNEDATPELGTPIASPSTPIPIDVDALFTLSQKLVGGGELDRNNAEPLAKLIGGDANLVRGFEELVAMGNPASEKALSGMSENASAVVHDILQYWYLGYFEEQPVENRADIFFGLPVWGTVPYVTQPTLCKGFGYWATDVNIDGE